MAQNKIIEIEINPTSIDADTLRAKLLHALILQNKSREEWKLGEVFQVKYKSGTFQKATIYEILLSNTIIRRKRNNLRGLRGYRYSVLNPVAMASGSDAEIFRVACTLKVEKKEAFTDPNAQKNRLVKVRHYKEIDEVKGKERLGSPKKQLANDDTLTLVARHLRAKPATKVYKRNRFSKEIETSYTEMRDFSLQQRTLAKLLIADARAQGWISEELTERSRSISLDTESINSSLGLSPSTNSNLSSANREISLSADSSVLSPSVSENMESELMTLNADQRITLSINLLRALKAIHDDLELIHLDLKLDNILVNPETLEVTIIDFSNSKRIGQKDIGSTISGHIDYTSTEEVDHEKNIYKVNTDKKTDIYAMGKIIRAIWGDNEILSLYINKLDKPNSAEDLLNRGMQELDNDGHKVKLRTALDGMLASIKPPNPKRLSTEDVLTAFKEVSLARGNNNIEQVSFERFKQAYLTEYQKTFFLFRNPFSTMHKMLTSGNKNNRFKTIEQVEAHVSKKLKSRTARVLARLKKS